MTVLFTAAHSGFSLEHVPLGGGAAVCEHLVQAWGRTRPFDWRVISPSILGARAPRDKDLVRISEWRYARFCRDFEQAITENIFTYDSRHTVVLSNDVSEGPDFHRLADKGYAIYTIYHVDVVDYFTRMYLHSFIKPETAAHFYARWSQTPLRYLLPDVLKLVLQKQQDSVLYSRGLIVPSERMKQVMLQCYPQISPSKIHVLPWGIWEEPIEEQHIAREAAEMRRTHGIPEKAFKLLTLSRISPEKGQDRLLKALAQWEDRTDFPSEGLVVFIAGEAAYMHGARFEKKLRRLAGRLRKTRVVFPGYVTGTRKRALFELADLYVFPSRHESYGLTLLEAMRAGLPALTSDDHGSHDLMSPEVGEIFPAAPEEELPGLMVGALRRLVADRGRLRAMGAAAKACAARHKFSDTAAKLAALLVH